MVEEANLGKIVNVERWLKENEESFKPPVCNSVMLVLTVKYHRRTPLEKCSGRAFLKWNSATCCFKDTVRNFIVLYFSIGLKYQHPILSGEMQVDGDWLMQFLSFMTETYSEPCQASKRDFFAKVVNEWKPWTIFRKSSVLDASPDS